MSGGWEQHGFPYVVHSCHGAFLDSPTLLSWVGQRRTRLGPPMCSQRRSDVSPQFGNRCVQWPDQGMLGDLELVWHRLLFHGISSIFHMSFRCSSKLMAQASLSNRVLLTRQFGSSRTGRGWLFARLCKEQRDCVRSVGRKGVK